MTSEPEGTGALSADSSGGVQAGPSAGTCRIETAENFGLRFAIKHGAFPCREDLMNKNWLASCLAIALCAVGAILALRFTDREQVSDLTHRIETGSDALRFTLPPLEHVANMELTDRDVAVLLREAIEENSADAANTPAGSKRAEHLSNQPVQPTATQPDRPGARISGNLIDVNFDLATLNGAAPTGLEFRKRVTVNGSNVGQATIRVGSGSALFISRDDLRGLLAATERADLLEDVASASGEPFIGFDEIRRKGLNLRYDAAGDQILISG